MRAALHPSGEILLGGGPSATLKAIDLSTGRTVRTFYPGRRAAQPKITEEQWDAAKRQYENWRGWNSERIKFVQHQCHLSDDELPGVMDELAQMVERWRKASEAGALEASEYPRRILFSEDGRLLFCTTDNGLRIFDWKALLASSEESPMPRFRLELEIPDLVPLALKKDAFGRRGTILA